LFVIISVMLVLSSSCRNISDSIENDGAPIASPLSICLGIGSNFAR
jgi:hypothetical protein